LTRAETNTRCNQSNQRGRESAYHTQAGGNFDQWEGRIEKTFDSPPGVYREACLRWSPDGKALQYLLTLGDVSNIWEQPLAGGSPKQITNFISGSIFDFNWSSDGKRLFMSRGEVSSDVVLLSNLR